MNTGGHNSVQLSNIRKLWIIPTDIFLHLKLLYAHGAVNMLAHIHDSPFLKKSTYFADVFLN